MAIPPRSNTSFPIRLFIDIPSPDVLDAMNAFVNDVNKYIANYAAGIPQNSKPVVQLPTGMPEGTEYWASNGRKIAEGPGAGTGVVVRYSLGVWRTVSTDAPVQV